MSGKIFDLTPESEGPRYPVRRSASFDYGSSAGEVYLARTMALERAAEDALRDADWAVRRRAARGQGGGEDAVTLALSLAGRGVDGADWEREVRRAAADQAAGTAYLARKREERLRCQAAEAAAGRASLTTAPTSAAGMVQAQAEVGREGGALSPDLSGRIHAKRGGGQPLEATVRRGMEGVFQVSFGHVRIHADGEADMLNRGVAAIAFTVGADIFFRAGAYQPHSVAGQHLLAHELTHVVQQRTGSLGASGGGGNSGGTMTVGAADDRHEQEAETTAHRVTAALQRRALLSQATTPGAGLARRHDPAAAFVPSAPGVARLATPDAMIQRWPWDDAINAVKGKVDDFLRGLPGFELLTVLLGQDPISGRQVARTPQSLAHAVLSLAPGGDALYQKLEEHKVLTKLFAWFGAHLAGLAAEVRTIPQRLSQVLGSLGLNLGDDFNRIKGVFTGAMGRLVSFAQGAVGKVAEVAVQAIMAAFGPLGERVYELLKTSGASLLDILKNPGPFAHNLGAAVGQGFHGFVAHIASHLKEGLLSLLTGGLLGAGVTLPAQLSLDAPGVITLALDVLNLGWDHLLALLTHKLGPRGQRVVALVQSGSQELGPAASVVQDLRKGPLAFAHHLVGGIGDLTGMLLGQVGDWLKTVVLPQAVIKVLSMVIPGAGVASLLLSLYNGIAFFVSHMDEIAAVVNRVLGALGRIMAGDIGPAAQAIEDTLGRVLPLALKFLFRLIGINIDSIGGRIKSFLSGIRARIDAALNKLLDFIVKHIPARLLDALGSKRDNQSSDSRHGHDGSQGTNAHRGPISVVKAFNMANESHHLYVEERDGKLTIEMASERRRNLQILVANALHKEQIGAGRSGVIQLLNQIKAQLQDLKEREAAATSKSDAEERHNIAVWVNTIAEILEGIGREFNIPDLSDLGHPSKYAEGDRLKPQYLGASFRDTFYGDWNTAAQQYRRQELQKLRQKAQDPKWRNDPLYGKPGVFECLGEGCPPHLALKAHLDHIEEVSAQWNREGHDQTQAERQRWYNMPNNLRIICEHCNTSKGGPRVIPTVGKHFRGPGES